MTAAADGNTTIKMDVYHDYQEGDLVKTSDILIESSDDVWDTMLWGTGEWGVDGTDFYVFRRQPSGGSAYAIQFKFSSSDNVGRWWIDSIALPFRRKEVR